MKSKFFLFILIFLSARLFAQGNDLEMSADFDASMAVKTVDGLEELVIVQTVSSSKASFVVRKGARQGVSVGQKALFSTEKVSILCKAIEVTREYSLWQVSDPKMQVPFTKRQYIVFNTSLETIWQKIPHLKEELNRRVAQIKIKPVPYWTLRGGSHRGLYTTVSETGSQASTDRQGLQLEVAYNSKLIETVDYAIGLRMDNETSTQESPNLTIPTIRYFLTGELTYNFPNFKNTSNHFYSGAGGGIGISQTTVDESKSAGTCFLGPIFRLGLLTKLSDKYGLMVEGSVESISQNEVFADGSRQTSNMVNARLSVGLRF